MSKIFITIVGEKQVGAEIKKLFLQKNSSESTSSSGDVCSGHQSATQSGNLIARAGDVCRKLRNRRSYSKKTKPCSNKEMQKGLVVINFQDKSVSDGVLREKEILYDGLMRYMTDMSEGNIREEIVRLVRQNTFHHMTCNLFNQKILILSDVSTNTQNALMEMSHLMLAASLKCIRMVPYMYVSTPLFCNW